MRRFRAAGLVFIGKTNIPELAIGPTTEPRLFGRFDLWLTPTLGQPPVELGTLVYRGGDPFELRRRSARFSPYTYVSNASGQPAISLPLHWTASGLPVGVHFTARWGEEATLIRLAGQLERARPWAERRPGVRAA